MRTAILLAASLGFLAAGLGTAAVFPLSLALLSLAD